MVEDRGSLLGRAVCTGFNTAYRDRMRNDHRKGNEHRIVIGTVSSGQTMSVKENYRQWMTPDGI